MKTLLITIALLITVNGFCQKYNVGLVKVGPDIKNLEGEIIITDSTVISNFDGRSSTFKITNRKGYTIHVPDGKYVISHAAGRVHGFTYDRHITYHPEKHQPGHTTSVFYCAIQPK